MDGSHGSTSVGHGIIFPAQLLSNLNIGAAKLYHPQSSSHSLRIGQAIGFFGCCDAEEKAPASRPGIGAALEVAGLREGEDNGLHRACI